MSTRENKRLDLQRDLDSRKGKEERNRLGQFATPTALAVDILRHAKRLLPRGKIRFLDPAFGTGSFYSALVSIFGKARITEAVGFEIDPHYGSPAAEFWRDTPLSITAADFTRQHAQPRFNLIVCNPPYVRHHHLANDEKNRLQRSTADACGIKIGGLAGLYCHFIGLTHSWLAPDALSYWLVPSEFMDVNYGSAIKRYLLERVTLLQIHRFDPSNVQFSDALVSSAIICFRNAPAPLTNAVMFSFGGTLSTPHISRVVPSSALAQEAKWTRFPAAEIRSRSPHPTIADFFQIKRGLATGDNSYFILRAEEIKARRLPLECFKPILPSPRHLITDDIKADRNGLPCVEPRLFLLDPNLPEEIIHRRYPVLGEYLEEGKARGLDKRYLCSHRAPWYAQESRPPPPIVCTYLGRSDKKTGRPFRFILNESRATVANVYLAMYPTPPLASALESDPNLLRKVWKELNSIKPEDLLAEGRVYGGGLHKLEPRELANVPVPGISSLLPKSVRPVVQQELIPAA